MFIGMHMFQMLYLPLIIIPGVAGHFIFVLDIILMNTQGLNFQQKERCSKEESLLYLMTGK